jgi:hypothetical protein
MMRTIRFNPEKDLAPTSFDERACLLALEMKNLGLIWQPHVGCFVWDPDKWIQPESPFPGRVYFILSLPRFVEILGSTQEMAQKLVWLPTWHQACLLIERMGAGCKSFVENHRLESHGDPTEALIQLYRRIADTLRERKGGL